jgi:hypothetical protein
MLKYKLMFFLLLEVILTVNAQKHNNLFPILVSKDYIYYFNSTDSTFYKYYNNSNIIYNFPTEKKALFQISNTGFGIIEFESPRISNGKRLKWIEDSVYVSINNNKGKYIIDYYHIKNNKKTTKIDYPVMRSDTTIEYTKALTSSRFTLPFVGIVNILSNRLIFQYYDNRITWEEENSNYYIDVDNNNRDRVNAIINKFIEYNTNKRNASNLKNVCKINLNFMELRTSKISVNDLILKLKHNQNIHKVEQAKSIHISKCNFTDDLKNEIFVTQDLETAYLMESECMLVGNREIKNIFEINDNSIMYTDENQNSNRIDTLCVSVSNLKNKGYILKYNQFTDEDDIDVGAFKFTSVKSDTIYNIKSSINDSTLIIDWIEIKDKVMDRTLLKINKQELQIVYDNHKIAIDDLFISRNNKFINDFIVKNISKESNQLSYEVIVGWKDTGVRFFCSEKTGNNFISKIITQTK